MNWLRLILMPLITWVITLTACHGAPTIVIDAGHGGHDRGGIPRQRYSEKVYALDVAQRLNSRLKAAGFKTVMTRTGDYFVTLGDRARMGNRQRNSVFVSIHFNADPRGTGFGIETYYYSRSASRLASRIHAQVVRDTGATSRFIRRRGFYVLRKTSAPAVLCELGFLTNKTEGAKIAGSSAYRQKLADAIARAIDAHY